MMKAKVQTKGPAARRKLPQPGGRLPREEVDARVEHLLNIALGEFAKHGFGGTSLDYLVDLTGVSKTTIFRRFGNKEGIFRTIMDRHVAALQADLWEIEMNVDDPHGTLTRFVEVFSEAAVRQPRGRALLRLVVMEANRFPGLGETLMTHALEGHRPLRDYLQRIMDKGILRPADPNELSIDLVALVSQGFRSMLDNFSFLDRPGRASEIATRFLKGWS